MEQQKNAVDWLLENENPEVHFCVCIQFHEEHAYARVGHSKFNLKHPLDE